MTLEDAKKTMNQINGKHLEEIYIPSLGRDVLFKPLTTADAKSLTRTSFDGSFNINIQMLKLSLFDVLCTEDLSKVQIKDDKDNVYPTLNSKTLTEPDYIAFLCGIRQILDNDVSYNLNCQNPECKHKWKHTVQVDEIFKDQLRKFKRQTLFFEKEDSRTGNIWKFELTDFNMVDWFFFRYMINTIKEKDPTSPEVINEGKFVRPILYIKNIWLNDEPIDNWSEITLPDKLEFYNNIAPSITINEKDDTDTLYKFIQKNFIEEIMEKKMLEYTVKCPGCGREYGGVFQLENFFTF